MITSNCKKAFEHLESVTSPGLLLNHHLELFFFLFYHLFIFGLNGHLGIENFHFMYFMYCTHRRMFLKNTSSKWAGIGTTLPPRPLLIAAFRSLDLGLRLWSLCFHFCAHLFLQPKISAQPSSSSSLSNLHVVRVADISENNATLLVHRLLVVGTAWRPSSIFALVFWDNDNFWLSF